MPTFCELYCAQAGCTPQAFHRAVFWRTLHWQAWPLAPVLMLGRYFESDHSLINECAQSSHMREIHDATRDFPYHPQNSSWLHRHAKLRVSTHRLRQLAQQYLPAPEPERSASASVPSPLTQPE